MSLTSLLAALFPKRAKAAAAEAEAPATASGVPDAAVSAETTDNGVRMHIAAHDPAFPAKREAAVASIIAAIDAVASAHGFAKKAKSWAKTGALGTVSIHLQRSPYGFDCNINLGFQPVNDLGIGPWAQDDFIALDHFCPAGATATLTYLDVHGDAEHLAQVMRQLSNALPWLSAHLTDPDAPNQPMQQGPQV
jgi:hypothetical protein